ncbi:MAG TPA: hypothetical protein VGS97_19775 [Actinocrinis sp.]|uniref:hypothetical protein n=1 Tax=Actinocrinis sp. TaxID=1920516 RepID=UPI002DDCDB8B|nr:hypothetical protein [Actinocrinis sp.]HEV2346349.1 hypothetical protein [Actinocrinis sp.]
MTEWTPVEQELRNALLLEFRDVLQDGRKVAEIALKTFDVLERLGWAKQEPTTGAAVREDNTESGSPVVTVYLNRGQAAIAGGMLIAESYRERDLGHVEMANELERIADQIVRALALALGH